MTVKLSGQGLSLFELAGIPVQTFASSDSTPSVGNGDAFDTSGATTVVRFDDSTQGQTIAVRATGPITVEHNASILLAGDIDFVMATGDVVLLTRFDATNVFVEVSRKQLAGGVPGEKRIDTIRVGDAESHDSATPKVVSQFQFDPTDYDTAVATRSLVFRAVVANGGGVASTNARLYNLTDGEAIATLNFTSATPTMKETTLTEGAGAGEVDLSAKVYEVRIFVDSPDAVDDTIELGSAELRVINTVD